MYTCLKITSSVLELNRIDLNIILQSKEKL